jgi:hypothetical protein
MNQTSGVLRATIRGAQWGLPWLSVLAISASVAFALTATMAADPSPTDALTTISAAQTPVHALVTAEAGASVTAAATVDRLGSGGACGATGGRLLYIGLNSWIPAETGAAGCPDSIP